MEMNALAGGLLPIGLTIILGFLLKRFLIPDDTHWVGVNKITFYFLIPGLIITTMIQAEVAAIPIGNIVIVLMIALALVIFALAAIYFAGPKTTASKSSFSSTFQTSTRWNAAIALAITGEIYGPVAVTIIALAMIVLIPVINIVNVALLANLLAERRISLLESFAKVITNPIIIGCLAGIALSWSETELWPAAKNTLDTLADAAVGLILLSVGAGLNLSRLSSEGRHLLVSCLLKLVLMPVFVLLAGGFFGLGGVMLTSLVIVAAVPTAMHGYVLAREMGGDAPLYANAASLQVVLSFVTLPCWIWVAGIVRG